MKTMFGNLTQQDIEEGKKFIDLFSELPEAERMQVRIYTQALIDRNDIMKDLEPIQKAATG